MAKISVVLLADVETHGDLGRVANALSLVKVAKEAGAAEPLVRRTESGQGLSASASDGSMV